jgi:hypothetical protein
MLKLVEFALLAVSILIIFGLVAASPHEVPPPEIDPIGARKLEGQ